MNAREQDPGPRRIPRIPWSAALAATLAPSLLHAQDAPTPTPREAPDAGEDESRSSPAPLLALRARWRAYVPSIDPADEPGRRPLRELLDGSDGARDAHQAVIAEFDRCRPALETAYGAEAIDLVRRVLVRRGPMPMELMLTRMAVPETASYAARVPAWERRAALLYRLGREGRFDDETYAVALENLREDLRESLRDEALIAAGLLPERYGNEPEGDAAERPLPAGADEVLRRLDPAISRARALLEEIGVRVPPRVEDIPPDVRARIEALLPLLSHDAWETRERATTDLISLGESVLPFVRPLLADRDPEVAALAGRIWGTVY